MNTTTKPTREQLLVLVERAGALMANTMFNLAQRAGYTLTSDDASLFDTMRRDWDNALGNLRIAGFIASGANEPDAAASAVLPAARVMSSASTYENGPEGMPRVERMPYAVLDCIIDHSLFRYQGGALEGEDRDRLYALLHDTAEEVLARVPSWPATSAAQPGDAKPIDCGGEPSAAECNACSGTGVFQGEDCGACTASHPQGQDGGEAK